MQINSFVSFYRKPYFKPGQSQLVLVVLCMAAMVYMAVGDDDVMHRAGVGKPLYVKEYTDSDGKIRFTQLEGWKCVLFGSH
ncbi:hypothetical protein TNCV_3766291 [Trichonephila clavipes]|nr:hypothetical protein TNCV_3766291 [Trichonephila clavipes]